MRRNKDYIHYNTILHTHTHTHNRSYVSMSHTGATETLKAEAVFEEIGKNIAKVTIINNV